MGDRRRNGEKVRFRFPILHRVWPLEKLSDSFDFDLETIVMARVKNFRDVELPIPTICVHEVSQLRPMNYGMKCYRL